MTVPVIELRGVTQADGRTPVLRGVDLAVHEHRAVVVIGAPGSGTSTLLRCADLLDEIDDGDVLVDGEVITEPGVRPQATRRRLGMVLGTSSLFPHLTVLENVTLSPVRVHGVPKAEAKERARELLARFGLVGREDEHPDRLSAGQQQRVAIARAVATRPRALLLDDVTGALDPPLVGQVLEVVRQLKRDGTTMLVATHELQVAREVADEVCVLHEGRIVERGTPAEVLGPPREDEARRFLARLPEAGQA